MKPQADYKVWKDAEGNYYATVIVLINPYDMNKCKVIHRMYDREGNEWYCDLDDPVLIQENVFKYITSFCPREFLRRFKRRVRPLIGETRSGRDDLGEAYTRRAEVLATRL